MPDHEYRYGDDAELELRHVEIRADVAKRELTGIVMPYQQQANIAGMFRELVLPGAFGADIESTDAVWMTRQHVRHLTLGRSGRTIKLTDTPSGLAMRATLPDTPLARETVQLVADGILGGLSVEMRVRRDSWAGDLRTIHAALLTRFSVVDQGAYDGAVVSARARELAPAHIGHVRRFLAV